MGLLWGVWISASAPLTAGEIRFEDITRSTGVLDSIAGLMGHGGAWGDFDNDGRVDFMVGGFCDRPDEEYAPAKGPVPNRLLRNLGQGKFEVVDAPEITRYGRASGAIFADFNNDDGLELYIANNAKAGPAKKGTPEIQAAAKQLRSLLLQNSKSGWKNISSESQACPESLQTARNIAPIDIDRDGLLDLLIVEDRFRRMPSSRLFRNLGNLKFEDVTERSGMPGDLFGLGHAVADLNDDGLPDFIIGHSNRGFLSQPGGRYRESAAIRSALSWKPLHGEDWPCGVAIGDLNRDGLFDVVIASHCETARNRVYLNTGTAQAPEFKDVTAEVGLPDSLPVKCPHVEIQDFDNDGWPDLYFSAGWKMSDGSSVPLIYRHSGLKNGLPRFEIPQAPAGGQMVYYPAAPSADFDRDGRLDLFLVNWYRGDHCHFLKNVTNSQHWLQVTVKGASFNRMGLGSRIHVYESGHAGEPGHLLALQELQIGSGYASGHEAVCHFGLGRQAEVDLIIRLPNGRTIDRHNVQANQRLAINETGE